MVVVHKHAALLRKVHADSYSTEQPFSGADVELLILYVTPSGSGERRNDVFLPQLRKEV